MEKIKRLWKFFITLFLICVIIFNWNEILIFSNYKIIWHKFVSLFEHSQKPSSTALANKENKLEIPKINVSAPIIVGPSRELKKGILLYPGTLPGQKGKAIILGHSAPIGWPDINYDNVFSNINQLENGDEVIVFYNKKKYIYEVFTQKVFLPKDEEQALSIEDKNQSVLILLTCWPPGKNYKRLGVLTKLIK
jgi:LPXTG-site transpeptidase (sortase) family protein